MGGSLAVTIREPSGVEHRMCRWTNPTPYFVNSPKLVAKDKAYLKDYLKQWYEMVEDLKLPKGKRQHPMTECYAPHPYLAPCEYGLLVIDMQKDAILHSQGYTSYGGQDVIGLQLELEELKQRKGGNVFLHVGATQPDSKLASLRGFAAEGRVRRIAAYNHATGGFVEVRPLGGVPFDEIVKFVGGLERDRHYRIEYDMSPFKVERFADHDKQGLEALRSRVLELGFKLSKKEHEIWDEFARGDDE
jgi:hypothetical protein